MAQEFSLESGARDFFVYSAFFLPIGASASAVVNVPIQADSAFAIMEITGDERDLTTNETNVAFPALTLLLRDGGSGRVLMDQAQVWTNIVGTAQRPFYLPHPKILNPNSTLVVELTNQAAAVRQARISFVGFKIFP